MARCVIAKGLDAMNDSLVERILEDQFDAEEFPLEQIPAVMIKLAAVQASLQTRLLTAGPDKRELEANNLLDAEEVADWLGVKEDYVRELGRRGEIPSVQIGKYVRFERSAVRDWIGQHRDKAFHSDHEKRQNRKR